MTETQTIPWRRISVETAAILEDRLDESIELVEKELQELTN